LKSEKKVIVNGFNVFKVLTEAIYDYSISPERNVLCITKNSNNNPNLIELVGESTLL
jgi:hypothetical protein